MNYVVGLRCRECGRQYPAEALTGKRIDTIISGMYINPERSQVVDFIPYMRVGDQLLVAKGNPLHLTAPADLCDHRLAAPRTQRRDYQLVWQPVSG